jgi:Membrane proteins related to metalloendopeptidases
MAARGGKILAAGNNGKYQYGRYVLIQHDNGLTSLYAHLSKQAVATGDTVPEGHIIGYVGNTGYSFGNHLHFTVYWSDSVILKVLPTCNCGAVPVGVTGKP